MPVVVATGVASRPLRGRRGTEAVSVEEVAGRGRYPGRPFTPHLVLDEFLASPDLAAVESYALDHQADFVESALLEAGWTSARRDRGRRRSSVLYDPAASGQLFVDRLRAVLPAVLTACGLDPPWFRQVEIQMTATNDGGFFGCHVDNFSQALRHRVLSYVYFFHQEPQAFTGGQLRIYDLAATDPDPRRARSVDIEPVRNRLVFFPSGFLHEIVPVTCPSGAFVDGRFTLNGWLSP
jgi:SM-20-related protein